MARTVDPRGWIGHELGQTAYPVPVSVHGKRSAVRTIQETCHVRPEIERVCGALSRSALVPDQNGGGEVRGGVR
jgi:hypothetical protein